jgi:general stress protein 26
MTEPAKRQFVLQLITTAPATYLATIGPDGGPEIRAMLNLRNRQQYPGLVELYAAHADDLLVYLTTNTSSAKLDQIRANPAAALYFCDPASFHGVMLAGPLRIVTDAPLKRRIWQDGWQQYYPGGPDDPDYTILSLHSTVAKGWHGGGRFELSVP